MRFEDALLFWCLYGYIILVAAGTYPVAALVGQDNFGFRITGYFHLQQEPVVLPFPYALDETVYALITNRAA